MVHTQNTRHLKNNNFVVKRPRTGIDLIFLKDLGPKLWYGVQEVV